MTQPAKAQEPSMEEILASIRRIIADDDASKTPPRAPEPPKSEPEPAPPVFSAPPPRRRSCRRGRTLKPSQLGRWRHRARLRIATVADQASDILDLTESMAAPMPQPPPPPPPIIRPVPCQIPQQFRTIDGSSDVGFDEASERPGPAMSGDQERGQLVSGETSAAVNSAFNALAQTVLVQNARTLEDLVREMLRPMLKTWLDDNLPGMVERLVRAEIERVSRGRATLAIETQLALERGGELERLSGQHRRIFLKASRRL